MSTSDDYASLSHYPVGEARLQQNLAGARQRQLRRRLKRASARGVLAAMLFMALCFLGYEWLTPAGVPGPLHALATEPLNELEAKTDEKRVPLDDGSVLSVKRGAVLRVVENTGSRFTAALDSGEVEFSVKPGGPRTWTVETGPVRVEVIGTVFSVEKGPHKVHIQVTRGHVLVRGVNVPKYTRHLYAGDSFEVAVEGNGTANEPATNSPPPRVIPEKIAPLLPHVETSASPKPTEVSADPTEPKQDSKNSGAALLAEADAARNAGHPREAERLLEELLRGGSEEAGKGIAALTLGRLRLDVLGNPSGAAQALTMALRFGLPASLEEQAEARRIQAIARAGDARTARELASKYRQKYGQGAWRARVDGWAPPP